MLRSVRVIKTESRLSSTSFHGVTVLSLTDTRGCHGDKWPLLLLKTLVQVPLDNVIGYFQFLSFLQWQILRMAEEGMTVTP